MDVAASEFYKWVERPKSDENNEWVNSYLLIVLYRDGKYDLDFKNAASDPSQWIDGDELSKLYQEFIKEYPMISIEDPFDQDHWEAWSKLTANTTIQVSPNSSILFDFIFF